ncbi:hypothetical protein BX666DRAFT_514590 [Dichotomocladium elegans]|nr:hypothetical protein BX666DRAFT_514590 [Dichotomocladium elegans]
MLAVCGPMAYINFHTRANPPQLWGTSPSLKEMEPTDQPTLNSSQPSILQPEAKIGAKICLMENQQKLARVCDDVQEEFMLVKSKITKTQARA